MTESHRAELEARRKALRARIALAATMGKVVRHYDAAVFTNVKGAGICPGTCVSTAFSAGPIAAFSHPSPQGMRCSSCEGLR